MKYQKVKKMLACSLVAAVAAAPVMAYAAGTETETERVSEAAETEQESETEPDAELEDIALPLENGTLQIRNEAVEIAGAELAESGAEAEVSEDGAEEPAGDGTDSTVWDLVLTEADGTVHTFEGVSVDQWTEPALVSEFEWLYITWTDENGTARETAESGEEKVLEEPAPAWVTTDVYMRSEPSAEGEVVAVCEIGTEIEATGSVSGWVHIVNGEAEGYISHRFVTADPDTAESAVRAEEYAQEMAAQAAAQAAAAAAQTRQRSGSGKTEVSRQAYDDCDGSGHGYYEITYSDRSVAYEDY